MKNSILEYIDRIENRVINLSEMLNQATDYQTKLRLETKKSIYMDVWKELKELVKDEDES